MTNLVAGIDLGSTGIKVLVADEHGAEIVVRQKPTPWLNGQSGATELNATDLVSTVIQLFTEITDHLSTLSEYAGKRVLSIAISGMGETGFVLDSAGDPLTQGIAWFDPRGAAEVAALPEAIRAEFAGRTGVPWGVQVTAAKLLFLANRGLELQGTRWASLPEYLAFALTGRLVSDVSLSARTGLIDQDTGRPWPAMLDHLGVDESFVPEIVAAGTPLGTTAEVGLPWGFQAATVCVAGHDHLVSAVSGGLTSGDGYHVSLGTAEVLLRVIDKPLTFEVRQRLGEALINCVPHVIPGQFMLVAGVKTGLIMRRCLSLFGINDAAARDALDVATTALGADLDLTPGSVEVSGARNDDGVLALTIRGDGVRPEHVFRAALQHGNDEILRLIDILDADIPPATASLLTGGWTGMSSVCAARRQALPGMRVSSRSQDTAQGAAMFAARLLPTTTPQTPAQPEETKMNQLTAPERRGMTSICTPEGQMLIVAADQRNGMKAVMNAPDGPSSISIEQLREAKRDMVRHLGNFAPAILLDPEVPLPHIVDEGILGRDTALVVGMDSSGFDVVDGLRFTKFVPGVTPRTVRDLGGSVAKMLWYARPDQQDINSRLADEIRELVQACTDEGLLLIVEILTYQLESETAEEYAAKFPQLIADSAAMAVELGAKVLKLPYPGSAEGCAAVTKAAAGVPWAVLSAGVDHSTFIEQVRIAVANGAAGAMAGRSLWKDSLAMTNEGREAGLTGKSQPRLAELREAVLGR